eukprot:Skav203883  [mRNA]  locus=scaffold1649:69636:82121:+ [translate_table: standard]
MQVSWIILVLCYLSCFPWQTASFWTGSQHFALELSAAHANEMGALTVLFLSLPAKAVEPVQFQSLDDIGKFATTLRSLGDVLGKPRTGFGLKPAHPKSSNGLILMLTPKKKAIGDESFTSHLALECAKLVEDASTGGKDLWHKPLAPALAAYKMEQPLSFQDGALAWGGSDNNDASDEGVPAESPAPVPSPPQPSQPSQPSKPSYEPSYAPVTPRAPASSISVWQKIAELDSFDVDAWCRDMQQHGRSSSDQITELSKIVGQFQELLRFLASQVLSVSKESVTRSQESLLSPRLVSPFAATRQVLHGSHLASTGNLVTALSPRNPTDQRGESLSSSPLTRSCSANYPARIQAVEAAAEEGRREKDVGTPGFSSPGEEMGAVQPKCCATQEVQNTAGEAASETKLLGDQPIPPVGKPLWLAEAEEYVTLQKQKEAEQARSRGLRRGESEGGDQGFRIASDAQ